MEPAKITYSVKTEWAEKYEDTQETYVGTCINNKPVAVNIRIWNNKYGIIPVKDLKKFNLTFSFDKYEDNNLLKFIKIIYKNDKEMAIDIHKDTLIATFLEDIMISGKENNGSDIDYDNYIDIKIVFLIPEGLELKERDLKSLFLEIIEL